MTATIQNKISVIIPAHNEQCNILATIKSISDNIELIDLPYEIIVIDDGSTDNTFRLVSEYKGVNPRVAIHSHLKGLGKGAALKYGYEIANGEFIFFIDADGQIDAKYIPSFIKMLGMHQADGVIGNKRHAYSIVDYGIKRWLVSNGYYFLVKILFNFHLKDTQCGFKLFKKTALDKVMEVITVKKFAFDIELLTALKQNRQMIIDAPIVMSSPEGVGSVSLKNITETLKDTLGVFKRKLTGYYKNA